MKPPPLLTFLCLLVAPAGGNLVQFGVMIERMTGKPALQYNDYGCYCGVGGSHWPVDPTDWCCHAHDCCYGRLEKLGCEPKLERYLFSASRHSILCAGKTACQRQTCECDRTAALCFRHHLGTYNRNFVRYPNKLCSGPRRPARAGPTHLIPGPQRPWAMQTPKALPPEGSFPANPSFPESSRTVAWTIAGLPGHMLP